MILPRRLMLSSLVVSGLLLGAGAAALRAEMRTFTDTQGRTLQAELVSLDDDQVTIRRDDGQTFTVPISTFSEGDRKDIRAWAAKQADMLPPGSLRVQTSRLAFDSKKKPDGQGVTLTTEHWGYGITLDNRTGKTINGLRMDCILFVTPGLEPGQTTHAPLRQVASSREIEPITAYGTIQFHSPAITVLRADLDPGYIWKKGGSMPVVDELHGIWLRFYKGDQLVAEICSPESLSKTQTWIAPARKARADSGQ